MADIGTTLMARARVTRGGPSSDSVASRFPSLSDQSRVVSYCCDRPNVRRSVDELSPGRSPFTPPPRVSCVSHRDVVWINFGFESGKISGTSAVTCRTRTPLAELEALATFFFLFCSVFRSTNRRRRWALQRARGASSASSPPVEAPPQGTGRAAPRRRQSRETPAPPPRQSTVSAHASVSPLREKRTEREADGCREARDASERGMRVSRRRPRRQAGFVVAEG